MRESNLDILLKNMKPFLHDDTYVFLTSTTGFSQEEKNKSIMVFKETEGETLIIKEVLITANNSANKDIWAMITLTIHSDLNAVGFLAVITSKLAKKGLPVNAVSAFYHDHLFVPWNQKHNAINSLREIQVNEID